MLIDYMWLAEKTSELSGCLRKKVGAAVELTGSINYPISGCNHLPAGIDNNICLNCPREGKLHGYWNHDPGRDCPVIHSERDVIYKAARLGISLSGGTLYVTYKPCLPCAIAVAEAGIKKVIYRDEYPGGQDVEDYFKKCGVELIRFGR